MRPVPEVLKRLESRLIVSCQAARGNAFDDPACMARFAAAVVAGGAAGIRADGAANIRAVRRVLSVPIIGIRKRLQLDGLVLITPSMEDARALVAAGADAVALDCTARGQNYGALERIRRIKSELGVPVMADIATIEEAVAAAGAGADFVLSTLRGYTAETRAVQEFEPDFISQLLRAVNVPVIAEGRIHSPEQARQALSAGAFAVIVGTAITRPGDIARRFVSALGRPQPGTPPGHIIGIDLGGTNTKSGLISPAGELAFSSVCPTPAATGRQALLGHLVSVARDCQERAASAKVPVSAIGVATAGWVDPSTGEVVYATENLPGWTGAQVAGELHAATGLPVAVENDANALAVGEKHFGAARNASHFVCITLGTGVGGGCYIGGGLNRGAHFFANALGHIPIEAEGLPCTCGQRGCLEAYANSAALLRYAAPGAFGSAEELIAAANLGDQDAQQAVRTLARHLAIGCASLVNLLDPEMLILSGGIAQNNPQLLTALEEELAARVTVWNRRRLRVASSCLGYHGGVLGAAAVALEKFGG